MNFLQGLGSVAGGLEQGLPQGFNLNQAVQQSQGQEAAGQALIQLYGGAGQQPVGAPPNLFGGQGQQPQMPPAAPPNVQAGPQAGPAQAPPAPPNLVASQQTNLAQQQSPRIPPSQLIPQGQPGTAQPSAPLPTPQPAPQPAPPQQPPSQMQPQQPPQQPPPQIGGGGKGMDQGGMLSLPQIIQGIMKTNPRASGRQVFQAVNALTPIMNSQGLQQYRALGQQLGFERLGLGYDRLAQQSDEFAKREGRLQSKETANEKWRTESLGISEARQKATQDFQAERSRITSDISLSSEDRQKQMQAAIDKYNTEMDGIDKQIKSLRAPDKGEEETDQSGQDYGEMNGKLYHYKGKGDRSDMKNWEPVQ